MAQPLDLGRRISLIDLYDLRMPQRTGTYVLHEENLAIVETGPSPSVPHLLAGLKALHIDPSDIRYIIVTHIHLDHAGGVGLLLQHCPNAMVVVHPKGKRHLADPSRLIAGAKAVYGAQFESLFDPILPVPEERLIVKEDGETLKLSAERTLVFYDTPGHANHHVSIYDSYSRGVFTGDTIGVFYPQLQEAGLTFCLPSTSPNQFDPEAMKQSAARLEKLRPERIYFGHFGMLDDPQEAFRQLRVWLPKFVAAGKEAIERNPEASPAEQAKVAAQRLRRDVEAFLNEYGVPSSSPVYAAIELDLQVCAMGLIDYWHKRR
ncbi:beta lactamase-like protein [Geobacillus sp. GHH01]|uniref:MBL fold metallo-hydrolase n=1 Tax=unclassified Geobacillus TaxID=2642459 RepID=UPI0002AF26D3|nr:MULTISPECIES: MBL fold metallo-hydrolase [unclassified Geobacillus]AGE22187.1 beta lactamase-like protein [Geobacillus sp. GHH01]RXS85504.1 MBL fold metallo-hydrolase [Geobacillus sp. PK12]